MPPISGDVVSGFAHRFVPLQREGIEQRLNLQMRFEGCCDYPYDLLVPVVNDTHGACSTRIEPNIRCDRFFSRDCFVLEALLVEQNREAMHLGEFLHHPMQGRIV